jgi:hypothetical protein
MVVTLAVGIAIGVLLTKKLAPAQAQAKPGFGFAAVPGEKGGQDITGPYEVVPDWPKPLSSLPGHEKWTWGAVEGIFAQNPNRVFIVQRGELPVMTRPKNTPIPNFGPSLSFPVNETPFRNASQGPVAALPGEGGADVVCGDPESLPCPGWEGKVGVDARWEHCLIVVDAQGNIVEDWSQWNSLFRRPHAVYINPYDAEKRVWVVDDARHAIFVFTNDGKKLVQTLGTPNVPGADGTHFNRPTFLAWLPDSTLFVRTDTTARASRSSIRMESSCWTGASAAIRRTRHARATSTRCTALPWIQCRTGSLSTTEPIAAAKCSTKTGSFSISGPTATHRPPIHFIFQRIATCGSPTVRPGSS